jgi:hypothetical protein
MLNKGRHSSPSATAMARVAESRVVRASTVSGEHETHCYANPAVPSRSESPSTQPYLGHLPYSSGGAAGVDDLVVTSGL